MGSEENEDGRNKERENVCRPPHGSAEYTEWPLHRGDRIRRMFAHKTVPPFSRSVSYMELGKGAVFWTISSFRDTSTDIPYVPSY